MSSTWMKSAIFSAVVALCAGSSFAQQPTARDTVPENMGFNIPYGAPIVLDRADAAITAAVAEAKKHNWPMNIAVMDDGVIWSRSNAWMARSSRQ